MLVGKIMVLLVDDQPATRQGLRLRLAIEPDIAVVGEAGDGQAAVDLAGKLAPDVVVMDVTMPIMDGIAATRALREAVPTSAVVILTLHDDTATRNRALAAGAVALIAKHQPPNDLLAAIRAAATAAVGASTASPDL
jgi:two-component system, NarL family, response regulator LiaR